MSAPRPDVIVPPLFGRAAVNALGAVPWGRLKHAYGVGKVSDSLEGDVEAALRAFASDDAATVEAAANALWSNVCHQSTIYEVSAYAVPFIAAITAGEDRVTFRLQVGAALLADVANASSFETEHGFRAGSYGEGVGPATHAALRLADPALVAIAERIPQYRPFIAALRTFAKKKSVSRGDANRLMKLEERARGTAE